MRNGLGLVIELIWLFISDRSNVVLQIELVCVVDNVCDRVMDVSGHLGEFLVELVNSSDQ